MKTDFSYAAGTASLEAAQSGALDVLDFEIPGILFQAALAHYNVIFCVTAGV
jgi:hypothetical protein